MTLELIPLAQAALFLDLDGTLAPIAARPEDVGPDRDRNALLRRLGRELNGRLAVVSGRSIDDVDRILDASVRCVAGVHGLERRRADGTIVSAEPHPELDRVYTELEKFKHERPGTHLEFKMLGLALHFRQAPAVANEALEIARRLAWSTGMKLQQGNMVVELRSPGADKGVTVRSYMDEMLFRDAAPIFIGDDLTDEDGFAAVEDLSGVGILVGARRTTYASAFLPDVDAVAAWLSEGLASGRFEIERTGAGRLGG